MDDFKRLSPDLILDAIDDLGYQTDARILELNSYENRVFQIGIESAEPVIAKFYRSNRWTTDMIIEEHQFAAALADNDLSVYPLLIKRGNHCSSSRNTALPYLKSAVAVRPRSTISIV